MGASPELNDKRSDYDVYWEGLGFRRVEDLTDLERQLSERSLFRRMRKARAVPVTMFVVVFFGLVVWDPPLHVFLLCVVGLAALSTAACLVSGLRAHLDFRKKSVFHGPAQVVPASSPLRRAMRRFGLTEGDLVAEVLPDGSLLALNGRPWGGSLLIGRSAGLKKSATRADAAQLSDDERLELKLHIFYAARYPDALAFTPLTAFVPILGRIRKEGPAPFLISLVIIVAATAAGLYWARTFRARLYRDIEEGGLDLVGNKRVLRHSRKAWTVGDRPAEWRRAYLSKGR